MNIKPFSADDNATRNTWLRSLTHEDVLALLRTTTGKCGNQCSTCDTNAFYILFTSDNGHTVGGIECLRAASASAYLIDQDRAAGLGVTGELVRIPTAAQKASAMENIGW